jgi:hypothetical protein
VPLVIDLDGLARADVGIVDVLARVALAARRQGRQVYLQRASPELREIVTLVGLGAVLRSVPAQSSRGGSPNRGKNRAVSRKKVMALIRPADSSTTWSDQGS